LAESNPRMAAMLFKDYEKDAALEILKQRSMNLKTMIETTLDTKQKAPYLKQLEAVNAALLNLSGVGKQQMLPATGAPQGKVDTSNPLLK